MTSLGDFRFFRTIWYSVLLDDVTECSVVSSQQGKLEFSGSSVTTDWQTKTWNIDLVANFYS